MKKSRGLWERLDFCFSMRFISCPMLVCRHRRLDRSRMHSHFGLLSDPSRCMPFIHRVRAFHAFLLLTIPWFYDLFRWNVQSLRLCRPSSLIGSYCAHSLTFSLVSAPSRFERSFCTFPYDFVSFPEIITTFFATLTQVSLLYASISSHGGPRHIK